VLRIFIALQSPSPSAGFEPANLGSNGTWDLSQLIKPLRWIIFGHPAQIMCTLSCLRTCTPVAASRQGYVIQYAELLCSVETTSLTTTSVLAFHIPQCHRNVQSKFSLKLSDKLNCSYAISHRKERDRV
jgi:hypothetical protein